MNVVMRFAPSLNRRTSRLVIGVGVVIIAASVIVAASLGTSAGPNSPSAASSVTGIGTVAWSNPTNAEASDNAYASSALNNQTSNYLEVTGFGFSIPSGSTITGVTVSVERSESGTADIRDASVSLLKASALVGTDHANTTSTWPSTDATASYGSGSDLWGTTLSTSDVNASGFGVAVAAKNYSTTGNFARIDYVSISVSYTSGGGGGGGSAPTNNVVPAASGSAVQGQSLVASVGFWSGSPTSYSYQWRRCNSAGASCVDISGATSTSYTVVSGDVGDTLRVHVVATNSSGSTGADSAATPVVLSSTTGFKATASSYGYSTLYDPSGIPYTAWTGAWINPADGSLWTAFTQSAGTATGTPAWVQTRLGFNPTGRDHWGAANETVYETSANHGTTWSAANPDGTTDMTTADATGAPGSSANCTSTGNGSGCPTYSDIPYSPQADIALTDGSLLRRVNGEDLKYDTTFSATAFLQTLAPGASTWSGIDYVLNPSSCSCTYQVSRIRRLSDGRLIALGEWWNSLPGQPHGTVHHLLAVSSDQGSTWTSALTIGSGVTEPTVDEWDAAELPNGDLLAVFRTGSTPAQGVLTPSGGGWTLSAVATTPFAASGHPELLETTEGAVLYIASGEIDYLSNAAAETDSTSWTKLPFSASGTDCTLVGSSYQCHSEYYPRSFEDPYDHTIYVFSHTGADDPYPPTGNESIVKQTFKLQAAP